MKRFNLFVFMAMVVAMCFFTGCGGKRIADMTTDDNYIITQWSDTNYSILQPSISPTEFGRANLLNSKANLNNQLAAQVGSGNAATVVGSYIGIIVNQDIRGTVCIQHPSQSEIISIRPGDYTVLTTTDIPDYIYACYENDKKFYKTKVYKKTKVYNGIKTDYGARLCDR